MTALNKYIHAVVYIEPESLLFQNFRAFDSVAHRGLTTLDRVALICETALVLALVCFENIEWLSAAFGEFTRIPP